MCETSVKLTMCFFLCALYASRRTGQVCGSKNLIEITRFSSANNQLYQLNSTEISIFVSFSILQQYLWTNSK